MRIKDFNRTTREFNVHLSSEERIRICSTCSRIYEVTSYHRSGSTPEEIELASKALEACRIITEKQTESRNNSFSLPVTTLLSLSDMLLHFAEDMDTRHWNFNILRTDQAKKLGNDIFNAYLYRARYDLTRPAPALRPELEKFVK